MLFVLVGDDALAERGDVFNMPGPGGTPSGASASARTGPEYAWRCIRPLRLLSETVTFPVSSPVGKDGAKQGGKDEKTRLEGED